MACAVAEPRRAARIWGRANQLREEVGTPLPPNEQPRYERQIATVHAAIGDDAAFDLAWREGRAMTLEQAVEYALKGKDA